MKIKPHQIVLTLVMSMLITLSGTVSLLRADTGICGNTNVTLPFTDVAGNPFFCQIAAAYFSGLTSGAGGSSYNPSGTVNRDQMAAFITRTLDQSLKRGSRRAALKQFWTPHDSFEVPLTTVGNHPLGVACDGADLWVANAGDGTVSRVRASDRKLLETWTGANTAERVLVAKGRIYVLGGSNGPAKLYQIDPTQPAGVVTTLNVNLGVGTADIAFDGERIWLTNDGGGIHLVSFSQNCNPCVTPVTTGLSAPVGLVYDGANMWVTDPGALKLKKLDASGAVIQSVAVGPNPRYPAFDGTNIWVPNGQSASVTVVRASTGTVVATLTGNGLDYPREVAFDGERVLVTDEAGGPGNTVSLWKATDLSPLGSFQVSAGADGVYGVCSDGLNFWITLSQAGKLARF